MRAMPSSGAYARILAAVALLQAAPALAAPDPSGVSAGQARFQYWCATCHAADPREGGRLLPGTASLAAKYKGARPAALEARDDLAPDYVKYVIRHGSEGMPTFRKTEISDEEAAQIGAYLSRNAK